MKKNILLLIVLCGFVFLSHISVAQLPTCHTIITPVAGHNGAYTFTATGTFSHVASLDWSFGDGTLGSGHNVTHTYSHSGHEIVCLSVTDSVVGCHDYVCDTILVSITTGGGCASHISYTHIDTTFSIFAHSSGTGPFTYIWSLPDGTTSTMPNPIITLPYTHGSSALPVYLILTDSTGCIDTSMSYIHTDSVLHTHNACQAYFVMMPDTGITGHYYAVDLSIGAGGTTDYLWSFGDGHSAMGHHTSHVYATPGHYTVCLSITDSIHGCHSSHCDSTFYAYKTLGGPMSSFSVGQSAAGVAEIKENTLLSAYPNPATTVIELRINNGERIERSAIYNTTGQKMAEYGTSPQLPIANLAKGMYFVEVKTTNGTYRTSFVK